MIWSDAKARAGEILRGLRAEMPDGDVRLVLRALGRAFNSGKPSARDYRIDDADWPTLLRDWREREGLIQSQAAARLGIHTKTLGEWERGESRPRGPIQPRIHEAIRKKMTAAARAGTPNVALSCRSTFVPSA